MINNKTILITGGCGFVGSNLCLQFKTKYPQSKVIAFDNLKRRGSELNISRLKNAGIEFIHGDIRIKSDLELVCKVDIIIDAAAEPSVLAGISESPDYLINTNFNGTYHTLELARKYNAAFIFLSTSRIYPIAALENISTTERSNRLEISENQCKDGISEYGISEKFPLDGARSLYGSSKLASELFVQEYQALFGIKTVINRCGVLTGPYQMGKVDQGVVVLWMARHFWKGKLSYIGYGGKGLQVRDILHIDDLFDLLDFQINNLDKVTGNIFNVGGGREISVSLKELTLYCEKITGNIIDIAEVPEARTADIPIYISDCRKVKNSCNWQPQRNVEKILTDIYTWIKENEEQLKPILN